MCEHFVSLMAATFTGESNIFELDEFTINVIVQRC